jgi:hypothetical protein
LQLGQLFIKHVARLIICGISLRTELFVQLLRELHRNGPRFLKLMIKLLTNRRAVTFDIPKLNLINLSRGRRLILTNKRKHLCPKLEGGGFDLGSHGHSGNQKKRRDAVATIVIPGLFFRNL